MLVLCVNFQPVYVKMILESKRAKLFPSNTYKVYVHLKFEWFFVMFEKVFVQFKEA